MPQKTSLALLLTLVLVALAPAAASAQTTNVAVGIGDQNASMFDQQPFKDLKLRKARYFIKWNAIDSRDELAKADAWVAAARRANVKPLMHIDGVFTTKLPSVAQYRSKVRKLVTRYRTVKEWGSWNEVNSRTQPTFKNPKRVAQYFLAMRSFCRGCTIVALDLLDAGNIKKYTRDFYRALGKRKSLAKIVGIHNYGDTNRNRVTGTRTIINAVKRENRKAQFWLTETGGLAFFATARGVSFDCDEARQARAIKQMFSLARRYRKDVKRLYPYNYFGTNCQGRFDAGIVNADGTPRPAYTELKNALRRFKR